MKPCTTCGHVSTGTFGNGKAYHECRMHAPTAAPEDATALWPFLSDTDIAIGCSEHKPLPPNVNRHSTAMEVTQ